MQLKIKFCTLKKKNQIHTPPTNTPWRNLRAGTHRAVAPTRRGRSQYRRRRAQVLLLAAAGERDSDLGRWKSQRRNLVLPSIPPLPWGVHPRHLRPKRSPHIPGPQADKWERCLPCCVPGASPGHPPASRHLHPVDTGTSVTHRASRKPYQAKQQQSWVGFVFFLILMHAWWEPKCSFLLPEQNITLKGLTQNPHFWGMGPIAPLDRAIRQISVGLNHE